MSSCDIAPLTRCELRLANYDLGATLASGQAFRWRCEEETWEGIIAGRWVRLRESKGSIFAEAVAPGDWRWLHDYLQSGTDINVVIASFPGDAPLLEAVAVCHGLRLLRQDPWECLASFICSSTKQIVQIKQIVGLLCERFGEPVAMPSGREILYAFPTAERLARCTEAELRACKMGFRAPYLLAAAKEVASGRLDLESLRELSCAAARERLMELPGVGRKVADCVLLFAYGFQAAFPVDVWVLKALQQLYFPRRRVKVKRILQFTETHFGPWAGYAQQYLFHYMRTKLPRTRRPAKRRRTLTSEAAR